jgi:hypothetical protein
LEQYARQARNTEAERKACEIRLRAERKCGQLSAALVTAPGRRRDLTSGHGAQRSETKAEALDRTSAQHLHERFPSLWCPY